MSAIFSINNINYKAFITNEGAPDARKTTRLLFEGRDKEQSVAFTTMTKVMGKLPAFMEPVIEWFYTFNNIAITAKIDNKDVKLLINKNSLIKRLDVKSKQLEHKNKSKIIEELNIFTLTGLKYKEWKCINKFAQNEFAKGVSGVKRYIPDSNNKLPFEIKIKKNQIAVPKKYIKIDLNSKEIKKILPFEQKILKLTGLTGEEWTTIEEFLKDEFAKGHYVDQYVKRFYPTGGNRLPRDVTVSNQKIYISSKSKQPLEQGLVKSFNIAVKINKAKNKVKKVAEITIKQESRSRGYRPEDENQLTKEFYSESKDKLSYTTRPFKTSIDYLNPCNGKDDFIYFQHLYEMGILKKSIKTLTPAEKLQVIIDACYGLRVVHEKGYVHRDVKNENIFLTKKDGVVRGCLADFGFTVPADERFVEFQGSGIYISPECYMIYSNLQSKMLQNNVTKPCDMYSLGITLQILFYHPDPENIFSKADPKDEKSLYPLKIDRSSDRLVCAKLNEAEAGLSAQEIKLRKLINRLTSVNPKERPDIQETIKELEEIKSMNLPSLLVGVFH